MVAGAVTDSERATSLYRILRGVIMPNIVGPQRQQESFLGPTSTYPHLLVHAHLGITSMTVRQVLMEVRSLKLVVTWSVALLCGSLSFKLLP